ncbi:MAG: nuclear transport factor 2 family protein [Thermoanaerobaculia bacterium]
MRFQLGSLSILLALAASAGGGAEPSRAEPLDLARRYLAAREATMQEGAKPADVEAALALCSEALVYEPPRVGIRMSGLDSVRHGMLDFLGGTRQARITVNESLAGRDVVAVRTEVAFEAAEGSTWTPVRRQQMWVFEVADGKIRRTHEYW